jgi:subtilisin family serine protease
MLHRTFLVSAVITLALTPFSNANQPAQQIIQIQNQTDHSPQSFVLPPNGAVNISQQAGQVQVQTLDPTQPQRLLVRLKDQPLRPYLKQQREKMRATGKLSRAERQQLSKSSQTQLQRVQKSQSQLLGELRRQKLLGQVHSQFTQLTNTLVITAEAGTIEQIRRLPQVAAVHPDAEVKALLTESVEITKAPQVWAMLDSQSRTVTGRGVTVAVLDTGIDHTHPDLGGCIGAGCKVAGGYNFVEGEDATNSMDQNGHGTHVAGIIAAKGVLTGVAPDVTLYAYKVLSDLGSGNDSGIIAALEKAVDPDGDPLTDDQIDIVNMSLGGANTPDSPVSEAANNAMVAGVIVVVAAGNRGSSYSTIDSPGNAEQVLTVGASDNSGTIADFSSRGPVEGKVYIKPELMAPGVQINSTKAGGDYVRFSGTSMAAPHVAGGAALLRQLYPDLIAAELKTLLINNSQDLGQDAFTQGAGQMDLARAANTKLLVSPALLSAGFVDIAQSNWSSSLPVKLKNIGNESLKINVITPEALPAGASVLVDPAGERELAAGQEAALTLQLMIDNLVLPFSDNQTLHYEANASIRYPGADLRLPLVFIKAARIDFEFDAPPSSLYIYAGDGSFAHSKSFSSCSEPALDYSVDLKPGTYHLIARLYNDNCVVDALAIKEGVLVDTLLRTSIERASAVHKLAIGNVTGLDGNPLPLDKKRTLLRGVHIRFADNDMEFFSYDGVDTEAIVWVPDLSSSIRLDVASLFTLGESTSSDVENYYLVSPEKPITHCF